MKQTGLSWATADELNTKRKEEAWNDQLVSVSDDSIEIGDRKLDYDEERPTAEHEALNY